MTISMTLSVCPRVTIRELLNGASVINSFYREVLLQFAHTFKFRLIYENNKGHFKKDLSAFLHEEVSNWMGNSQATLLTVVTLLFVEDSVYARFPHIYTNLISEIDILISTLRRETGGGILLTR